MDRYFVLESYPVSDLIYLENGKLPFSKARVDVEKYFGSTLKKKEKILIEKSGNKNTVAVYHEDSLLELRENIYLYGKLVEQSVLKSPDQLYSSVEYFDYNDSLLTNSYKCDLKKDKCVDTLDQTWFMYNNDGKIISYLNRSRENYGESIDRLFKTDHFDSNSYRIEYDEFGTIKRIFTRTFESSFYDEKGYKSAYKDNEVTLFCDSTGMVCSIKKGVFKVGMLNYKRTKDSLFVDLEFPGIKRQFILLYDNGQIQQKKSLVQKGRNKELQNLIYKYNENNNIIQFESDRLLYRRDVSDSSNYYRTKLNVMYDSLQRPVEIKLELFDSQYNREKSKNCKVYKYEYFE